MELNGVEADTSRRMYTTPALLESATCRYCGTVLVLHDGAGRPNGAWDELSEIVAAWCETGEGHGRCCGCGRRMGLNDWDWAPDQWGFGYLGLVFWNWPGLRPEFIDEVGRRLGHRMVYTGVKL